MSSRYFKPKPSTVHERFGDETVIVNLDTGSYYSAQEAGSFIWNLIVTEASEASITQKTQAAFLGDAQGIAQKTAKFIAQLVEEALVDPQPILDENGTAAIAPAEENRKPFVAPVLQKYTDMEEMLLLDPIHEVDEHGWPSVRKPQD